jgi:hypothetical protein
MSNCEWPKAQKVKVLQQKLYNLMMAAFPNELGALEIKLCIRTIIPLK